MMLTRAVCSICDGPELVHSQLQKGAELRRCSTCIQNERFGKEEVNFIKDEDSEWCTIKITSNGVPFCQAQATYGRSVHCDDGECYKIKIENHRKQKN